MWSDDHCHSLHVAPPIRRANSILKRRSYSSMWWQHSYGRSGVGRWQALCRTGRFFNPERLLWRSSEDGSGSRRRAPIRLSAANTGQSLGEEGFSIAAIRNRPVGARHAPESPRGGSGRLASTVAEWRRNCAANCGCTEDWLPSKAAVRNQ
jgi:hypothetical protein